MIKFYDFPNLRNHSRIKLVDLKMTARMDLLWEFYDMCTPQTTGSA